MLNIESVLSEHRIFNPSDAFTKQANIHDETQYQEMLRFAEQDYDEYWASLARTNISWHKLFSKKLVEKENSFTWFEDGLLNVSYNCLDRHIKDRADKTALIFESDNGRVETITYKGLLSKVSRFANALKKLNIVKGDRVLIYLPNSIEAVIAMQACARIGAIHSVVFGGFSAKSIHDRIIDVKAKIIITADGQMRGGKILPLKQNIDEALLMPNLEMVEKVIVQKRVGNDIKLNRNLDIWWHEAIDGLSDSCEPTWVEAEHPLFILYTSGSTGTPKGVQHSSAGYLLGAITTMQWVFDIKDNDIFWCTADVGWITGHTYLCYGPLACGVTEVVFEGIPTYPDAGRFWHMIEEHHVSIFYTAPTAIRALIKAGGDLPKQYDLSSLRLLGSVGEPINPEAWVWYYETIGNSQCPIVDTWWQTETGAHVLAPLPGITSLVPGSCTRSMPGIFVDIVDDAGEFVGSNSGGYLVIKKPFPSLLRSIWNNHERYINSYYPQDVAGGKFYVAGDSAYKDELGYFHILGRVDDVLNVSGHRLGTMEIESALVANSLVAEAAVVGKPDEIKGEAIVAFVICKGPIPEDDNAKKVLSEQLRAWVGKEIGNLARPDEVRFGSVLPKTRSGKIMRRILRSLAKGEAITQDVSTLENPEALELLK